MKTITFGKRKADIPTELCELTARQYEYYCLIALALASGDITPDYWRVRWFSFLLGLGRVDYTIYTPEIVAEVEAQKEAIDGFLIERSDGKIHLDFNTPANLLPEYLGYKGPGDWLDGLSFGKFVECLTVLESLNGAEADEVAAGYDRVAGIMYAIPDNEPVPMLLSFHAPTLLGSVWKAIQSAPVEINGRKIDFGIIFRGTGSSRPDDKTGWTGITFEVAAAGVFGTISDVEAADMWSVLLYLYRCKFEYLNEQKAVK